MKENKILIKFAQVITELKRNNYNVALKLLEKLNINEDEKHLQNKLFGSIYFKKKDWLKSSKFYYEVLKKDRKDLAVLNNLGVALFNLGKFNEAINFFTKLLKYEKNPSNTFKSLGITYKNIGNYQKAIENFLKSLEIQDSDITRERLIDTLNYHIPKNIKNSKILDINDKILNFNKNLKIQHPIKIISIRNFVNKNFSILNDLDIKYEETQIFRRNEINLNCDRHFKVFNEFKIIPKYCFNCFKVQITLENIVELIKLFLIFNNLNLRRNNIRKCVVETRNNVEGNYKGYIFCTGMKDAEDVFNIITKVISNNRIISKNIKIKHGCTEFYKEFPEFEKIEKNSNTNFDYLKSWEEIEKLYDNRYPKLNDNDQKIVGPTHNLINLSDILIIKNWITYAYLINDISYSKICNHEIKDSYLNNFIKDQIKFRQKSFH